MTEGRREYLPLDVSVISFLSLQVLENLPCHKVSKASPKSHVDPYFSCDHLIQPGVDIWICWFSEIVLLLEI